MGVASPHGFDNGDFIVHMLGSLWNYWFPERSTVVSLMTSRAEPFWQVYLDLLDLVACKSKLNVPVFQKRYWSLFTVRESQKNDGSQMYNLYDTNGLHYQEASKPAYGDKANSKYFSYAIDSQIKHVHAVYNRVINPSLIWMNNADFVVDGDRNIISFYTDPFSDPLVPKRVILDSAGNVVDYEIALWFSFSAWDLQFIYEQFGYALGIWMKSSTFYREFISSIWDLLVQGPSQTALKFAFSALTGVPFARETETVLTIIDESPTYMHVETDKNIYTFTGTSQIIVWPGQVLHIGDPMTTSLLFFEPSGNTGLTPGVRGIAMDSDLTRAEPFMGPIVFDNAEVSVNYVGLDINNKAIVRFDVSGFPTDVEKFWERAQVEGLKMGLTMADILDTRNVKASPTTPADLPATINPFNFAMDHIFFNNLFLVYIRPETFAPGAPGLGALDMLYPYLVPHTAYMIFVEMQPETDYYHVGDQTVSLGFFKGTSLTDQAAHNFAVDRGPVIRAIPGRCR